MQNFSSWMTDGLRSFAAVLRGLIAPYRARPRKRSGDERPEVEPVLSTMPLIISVPSRPPVSCVSVVIPALNEAKRIAEVVRHALADPATAEVIVIDDSSTDATAELARGAGAVVLTSSMLGKGASMRDGVLPARCEMLVYLDGDLAGLRNGIITDLCMPLVRGEADFVKARFGRGGGRVTELTAKPMLKIFFPEIAHFVQPLGGIIAAKKSLLMALEFEDDYGVDVGLLLDAHLAKAKIAEVDIGSLENDSQSLQDLTLMANEVGRVIFSRAKSAGRLHVEQVTAMFESQRLAAASIEYVLTRRRNRQRLLLLDMDGAVTPSSFALELARAAGHEADYALLVDDAKPHEVTPSAHRDRIANLFRYLHRHRFDQVARSIEIRPGVIEFVNQMKRRGFMVGLVSDSYFIAADIVRRRIFADFAMAHTIQFENDVCTGIVRLNPAFLADAQTSSHADNETCKSNVLRAFLADESRPRVNLSWAIGNGVDDLPLLRLADRAFCIEPKSPVANQESRITSVTSFSELLATLPDHELVELNAA